MELLVAVFLGLFLLEIVLQNYLSAKKIYRWQDDVASFSGKIRFVDFILWQNIMQAGFGGCRKLSELNLGNHVAAKIGRVSAIRGYDSKSLPGYFKHRVLPGFDVIEISKLGSEVTKIAKDVAKGAISFKVEKNLATKGNPFLLIADCKNADLFIAKETEKNKVVLDSGLTHAYKKKNTEVRRFTKIFYFLGKPEHGGKSLYYSINNGKSYELVSGVYDMQILYGIVINDFQKIKYFKASEIVDWGKVSRVMIDLKIKFKLFGRKSQKIYIRLRNRG